MTAKTKPKPKAVPKTKSDGVLVSYDQGRANLTAGGNQAALDFIKSLPALTDVQLMNVLEGTFNTERVAFILRSATAYEMITRKQADKDTAGLGIDTICNQLAREFSVDGRTIYRDYKMFEIHKDYLLELLVTAPERIMPREFFVESIRLEGSLAVSPSEVLEYYEERRDSTGGYFLSHAKRDRDKFNNGMTIDDVRAEDQLDRIDAVNKVKETGKKNETINEKFTNVRLVASHRMHYWMAKIMDEHGSFSAWVYDRAQKDFGLPPSARKKK